MTARTVIWWTFALLSFAGQVAVTWRWGWPAAVWMSAGIIFGGLWASFALLSSPRLYIEERPRGDRRCR